MAFKKWEVRPTDKEKASELSEKFNIDPFVAVLLVSRGIEKDVDVVNFLSDDFTMPSPFDLSIWTKRFLPFLKPWKTKKNLHLRRL